MKKIPVPDISFTPGFAWTMVALWVVALLGSCAVESARADVSINGTTYPRQPPEQCAEEGGCVWVSQEWLLERIREAKQEGETSPECFKKVKSP